MLNIPPHITDTIERVAARRHTSPTAVLEEAVKKYEQSTRGDGIYTVSLDGIPIFKGLYIPANTVSRALRRLVPGQRITFERVRSPRALRIRAGLEDWKLSPAGDSAGKD